MTQRHSRRSFVNRVVLPTLFAPVALQQSRSRAAEEQTQPPKITRPEPKKPARLPLDLVREFVSVSHFDLSRVKELIQEEPKLVYASWDQGGGDWETGLGAASHVGRRDIAETLLASGARKDIFAAAMLGERAVVQAMVKADSMMAMQNGPHGYKVLYHVAISGDVRTAETVLAKIDNRQRHLNQALSAAVRDGRYDMTRWILEQGATSVNKPNGIGEKPLRTAARRGDEDIVDLLKQFGASEVD